MIALLIIPAGLIVYLPIFIILALYRRKERRALGVPGPPWYLILLYMVCPIVFFILGMIALGAAKKCVFTPQINLEAISLAQEKYKSEYGHYAWGDRFFSSLECELMEDNYGYFCGSQVIHNKLSSSGSAIACGIGAESSALAEPSGRDWPLREKPESSATGFTCFAIGNDDLDPFPDVYKIHNGSSPINVIDDEHDLDESGLLLPSPNYQAKKFLPYFLRKAYPTLLYSALIIVLLIADEKKYRRARKG